MDVFVLHDLLTRRGTEVRHDINLEIRLVRERQRVVLHARRATEIAKHHYLYPTTRYIRDPGRPATTRGTNHGACVADSETGVARDSNK